MNGGKAIEKIEKIVDRIEGEKPLCLFRKIVEPYVIAGSGRHRMQRATIWGLPATCVVEKEWRIAQRLR